MNSNAACNLADEVHERDPECMILTKHVAHHPSVDTRTKTLVSERMLKRATFGFVTHDRGVTPGLVGK